MFHLDRTGQRIVGVLVEKQLSVPDSYPLTENALLLGCNQSSNREPVMALEPFQVAGALMALQQDDVVKRVEGASRVPKFRHDLEAALRVGRAELAVLAELLLRGPQAPGALKPRVARMGYHAEPEAIEQLLRDLAARSPALVAQLPLGPRERDRRWRHLLGDGSEETAAPTAAPAAPVTSAATRAPGADPSSRLDALERRVAELERRLRELSSPPQGD